ncbi:phosphatases II [Piromyces finnis]|uniref:protein-tyrosine-phosphatase n=1 Tax=Piromyces finnis TaxID=1754191 RepID=A0A1Y1VJI4_9FUNG|nr:phosphatases II [Piromyces finnis]|eukprot:ORX57870.1 phosphatases II [Piromyces finnis]
MVTKRRPKLTLNTAIVRKNSMNLKINTNLNSAVSLTRDERLNSSRNILTVLEGGKTYTKPIKILPNLYLGSCDATKDLSILLDKDITTILNLAAEVEKPNWFKTDHWMTLSNNHWVTKITQNQLEIMSNTSDSTNVNSPPSPPPSEDEDIKKENLNVSSQEQTTIFPLSPLPQKVYPTLQDLYSPQETIPSTPLSPKSPTTPTSISPSSQHTLVISPIETSFVDSICSSNTLVTPFVDTFSFSLPPETPFVDSISTPFPPETPYVDTLQVCNTTLTTLPETPYVDAFSTPLDQSPKQLPPETPYFDTYNNTSALPIPETPYVDAFSSQQQQQKYLAKLINHSQKSVNNSDLLQAISLSSASTPPSATLNAFNGSMMNKKIRESSNISIESTLSKMNDNKELEIHYYHQCWNHNQRNTQEKLLEAFNIIDSTRLEDQHSILVSCQQGVSRSATLVIAYVMKTKQWGLMKSYNFVKEKCPWIAPNITLINELSEFEQHLLQTQK